MENPLVLIATNTLNAYKALNKADSDLITEVTILIISSAQNGFDNVDSGLLLEVVKKHQNVVKEINKLL